MKLIVLSTSNNLIDGYHKALEDSLIKHGYDYEFFLYGFIFGQQYKTIKIWCDQYQGDATHVLYTDQWDTIALAPPEEVIEKFKAMECKMLISGEKACFPYEEDAALYPTAPTFWQFVNGGGCLFEIAYFKELCNREPFPDLKIMDPKWLMNCLLNNPIEVKLDYQCQIFQTLAHSNPNEWEVINDVVIDWDNSRATRIKNIATNTFPIFIHGNGKTPMQWVKDIAQ